MQPRGFWGGFITLSAISAIPFALGWSWLFSMMDGKPFSETLRSGGMVGGIIFGLIFGFIMAISLKVIKVVITFEERTAFISKINIALAEIGYHPESQTETLLTYKPSFQAGFLSGKISVQIDQASATMVGPNGYLKKLQKRMEQADAAPKKHTLRRVLIIGPVAVIVVFVLAGILYDLFLWDKKEPATTDSSSTFTPTASPKAPVETLEQVLDKAARVTAVKYDMVVTAAGQTAQSTVFWKGTRTRFDSTLNGTQVVLFQFSDNRTQVTYVPSQKIAQQQVINASNEELSSASPTQVAKTLLKQLPQTLGTETINGLPVLLVEGTSDDGSKYRAWIDKAHGFPVRIDTWTVDGKASIECKNVEYVYLPDSVFELPPDVKVTVAPAAPSSPGPTPKSSPTPLPVTVPRLYVNSDFRYSIEVLDGWTIDESDKGNVKIRSPDRQALVQIFGYNAKNNLDVWASHTIDFRSKEQDFQKLASERAVLPGSLDAYTLSAKWTTKGDTVLSRHLTLMTFKTTREIELITGSSDSIWEKYRVQLEQMAYSLAMSD